MKDISEIFCKSFCDNLKISEIDGGSYSVATPFEISSGDPVSFYILNTGDGKYRIEDDGSIVPSMIASGINVTEGARKKEFDRIISRYDISYQESTGELVSLPVEYDGLPELAFKFIDALLKLDALKAPLKQENVASMFREDVISAIHKSFDGKARIDETGKIADSISDFSPDLVVQVDGEKPLIIYLAINDQRIWEAIALKALANYEVHYDCSVMAMFDRVGTRMVTKTGIVRATNRLDSSAYFYDDLSGAMKKVQEEIGYEVRTVN